MLTIHCPCCGVSGEETEFHPGGEAHITRHATEAEDADVYRYLFERKNPKGVHFERWRHIYGCGKWFHVARCTVTLEVFGSYPAQTFEPPAELIAKIKAARPGWELTS